MARDPSHLWRRARTAASFPDRLVAVEDRIDALDRHVVDKIDEMRAELAQIRLLLNEQLGADADSTEVLGQLLQNTRARLAAVEERLDATNSAGPV